MPARWRPGVYLLAALTMLTAGCERNDSESAAGSGGDPGRCPHEIKKEKCPFCLPQLVEADGLCGEHGVAEALCHQCRPYLKAAFRAKGDWCARHAAPDSQCHACHPELKDKIQPGGGHALANHRSGAPAAPLCEHQIDKSKCPFCTPSLIQTDGFCAGHNVAEALCVKCRPYLEKAFKAKNDWCADHGLPMSQCLAHNSKPDTKPKADG